MTSRGTHTCIPHVPPHRLHTADTYSDDISLDFNWVNLITVISSRCLPYLCTQEGVSPRIPSNLMMSQSPCGICLHSLILISQSAFSSQFRPCPHRLQKPWDTPCFLHSDNINHAQPLASSMCNIKMLSTTCVSPRVIICSIQGKFVHLSSMHINLQIPCCLPFQ